MPKGSRKSTHVLLAEAEQQAKQAKARYDSLLAKKSTEDRAKDTKRKIILGGALIARARREGDIERLVMSLVEGVKASDKASFEGWSISLEAAVEKEAKRSDKSADGQQHETVEGSHS